MLTEADIASVRYARLDDEEIGITSLTRVFASVHEELVVTIPSFIYDPVAQDRKCNRTLTIGFERDGQKYELSAFVILDEVEYTIGQPKVLRFASLGGYTIVPTETKE